MRLETVGEEEWGAFLSQADDASPFHERYWLRAVERHSGLAKLLLIGYRGREPLVGLPAFVGRKVFARMFVSPPPGYGIPFLGPVFRGLEELRESRRYVVLREFVEAVQAGFLGGYWTAAKIDLGPWATDLRAFIERRFHVRPRYTYRVDLRRGHEAALMRMTKYVRRAAKAAQDSYRLRPATLEEIAWILEQVHLRYQAQRRGVKIPREYVDLLLNLAPEGRLHPYVAAENGELVTGSLCVSDDSTMYLWLASTKRGRGHQYAIEALLNEIMRRAAEMGYRWFDLVGANTPGIAHFKAKFNPELVPYVSVDRLPAPARALMMSMRVLGG